MAALKQVVIKHDHIGALYKDFLLLKMKKLTSLGNKPYWLVNVASKCWLKVSCACLILLPALALGHTQLISSEPANGQVIYESPANITIKFSKPIEKKFRLIELSPPNKKSGLPLEISGSDLSVYGRVPNLVPGQYKVRWRVLSNDGHIQRGQFSFELR
jgi:methionine-rich copper-binding protein CopC